MEALNYYIGFSKQYTDKNVVDQFNAMFSNNEKGIIQEILAKYDMQAARAD